jgi:predicted nicotinamide N-methyase
MGGCLPAAGIGEVEDYIRTRFALEPLAFRPDISLYRPTPKSGLAAFLEARDRADEPPYWAYAWAGGAALALYLMDHPDLVRGRTVLDFGSGSGLVAIAAAKAGATVSAFEPDALGQVALALNANVNGLDVALADPDAPAEIVLAGDVFYDADVAKRTLPVLLAHRARGATVLIGDPYRRDLPQNAMTRVADYDVPDMGGERVRAGVFALRP